MSGRKSRLTLQLSSRRTRNRKKSMCPTTSRNMASMVACGMAPLGPSAARSSRAKEAQASAVPPARSAACRKSSIRGQSPRGDSKASLKALPEAKFQASTSWSFAWAPKSSSLACATACSVHRGCACDHSATVSILFQQSSWFPCCKATRSASSTMASSALCPRRACAALTWRRKRSRPSSSMRSSMASLRLTGFASTRQP
mmetsp:Transcript_6631/g.13722  ORF Transcript_6631/g.13722 Transcript_6631/m.13722 type:complete len:201 (+) Transcript_6631:1429-2031(+)